jgi:VWFA-related protein
MARIIRFFALANLLLLLAVPGVSQAQDLPNGGTIRLTSRLVYVDVVARDRSGQVVRGLTQDDFKLEEDGHAQKIDFFAAHAYDEVSAKQSKPAAPSPQHPAQFSNVAAQGAPSGAINIILFDLLNTPTLEQPYARRQLLKFLLDLPPGQRTALFILTDRLKMLQGFTENSDRLQQAARAIDPRTFGLIRSPSEIMQDSDYAQSLPAGLRDALNRAQGEEDDVSYDRRARITILALDELAQSVSGYPGRKNLLWLSESFPLAAGAQLTESRFHEAINLPGAQETTALIASTQIAVYPISLLGLEESGIPSSGSGGSSVSAVGGPLGTKDHPQMGDTNQNQFDTRTTLRYAMNDLADRTGGEAFYGTNGFAEALRRSMLDGSNYYSLAYRPSNDKWNGQFRKIHVTLAHRNGSLSYRRGYFAFPDRPAPEDVQQKLNFAMQPDVPEFTTLTLHSTVRLPDQKHTSLRVDSVLDPSHLDFSTTPDGVRHARFNVMLVAMNDGPQSSAPPPQVTVPFQLDLTPERYRSALATGVPLHQELALKPGKYLLRLGVSDMASHDVGTLDMPVEIAGLPDHAR